MYGGANQDRRKNQNTAQNYGRRQTDYEQKYNKMRQQRDDYANNQMNSNYHQNNSSYGNDSYFGEQNRGNETFQYTQYGNEGYSDFKNQYKDKSYDSMSANYNNAENKRYSDSMYNGYNQYGNNNYNDNNYNSTNYNYDSLNYNGTGYGDNSYNSYNSTNYGNTNYGNYSDMDKSNNYTDYYNSSNPSNTYANGNQYSNGYSEPYSQYGNDYSNTIYDDSSRNKTYNDSSHKCDISVLQPGKSHPMMMIIIRICIIVFIGLALGEACRTVFNAFYQKHIYSSNPFAIIIRFLGIILVLFVSYLVHIILHEFGHLIGGTLSGYTLISFRIFSIILVKENKKNKIKRYPVMDTASECIMMPPEIKKGKYPYKLYRIGGLVMNLFTSLIAVILALGVSITGKYPWNMWCVLFALVGIVTVFYNGIPVVFDGVPNDGYILLHMIESNEARLAVHSQLLIYAFLSKGGSYSDVPYEQFCVNQTGEIKNFLVIRVKLLEYKWHLEHLDFNQAAKCLEATNHFFNSLPRAYQYEINSEKLFIEIMCEHDRDIIDKLYNADVRKYIEELQGDLSKSRIMMAYEAGVKGDMRSAHKYYMQLKNGAKNAPIKGETELELMLSEYVYERFCS